MAQKKVEIDGSKIADIELSNDDLQVSTLIARMIWIYVAESETPASNFQRFVRLMNTITSRGAFIYPEKENK